MNTKTVAVLGQGIIGTIWARHYASDGHSVRAWNRTAQPDNPWFAADATAAVAQADVVHICLAGPPSVEAVLTRILPSIGQNTLVIQSSTISPAAAEQFRSMVETQGADYVEAPFTGSKPAAEGKQLVYFLGGADAPRERADRWLTPISRKRFHFATPAQAAAIKLAMNLQIAAVSQAMTEGLALAEAYGLDAEQFFDVLDMNVARSGLVDLKKQKLLSKDYSPQFSVKHMHKDLDLALASSTNLKLCLTERCADIYADGLASGLGDDDFIALQQLIHSDQR
ncbi:MAG: NAD(P)-dependent oxidoreductase [Verrucomicrobia bacterium]|nr:NAD(P)-dependent oxidoreductase [Verrucomicrobiota bacterium]